MISCWAEVHAKFSWTAKDVMFVSVANDVCAPLLTLSHSSDRCLVGNVGFVHGSSQASIASKWKIPSVKKSLQTVLVTMFCNRELFWQVSDSNYILVTFSVKVRCSTSWTMQQSPITEEHFYEINFIFYFIWDRRELFSSAWSILI